MMKFDERFVELEKQFKELTSAITEGESRLADNKVSLERVRGAMIMLKEILADEADKSAVNKPKEPKDSDVIDVKEIAKDNYTNHPKPKKTK